MNHTLLSEIRLLIDELSIEVDRTKLDRLSSVLTEITQLGLMSQSEIESVIDFMRQLQTRVA